MSKWLPIESAPRDGTKIIGWDWIAAGAVFIEWNEKADCWTVSWNGEQNDDCTLWQPQPSSPTGEEE